MFSQVKEWIFGPSRLGKDWESCHGFCGDPHWESPLLVFKSNESSRADQGNHIDSSEYLDEPEVLEAKVVLVVEMLKKSKCCTAYTGAGLSRASGIEDYASKKNSIVSNFGELLNPLDAKPTFSHKVLVALEREGYIHHYIQQNHDGLPQKAGFPQEKINEIHGAWFDPSNPVVQFGGKLRSDLFKWMIQQEKETDLCLCLGTSLSGMNADRIAETPASKSKDKHSKVLGTVIINLQQTRLDSSSCIRIWAKLDDVFKIIADKLNLDVPSILDDDIEQFNDEYWIPYNAKGILDMNCRMLWNLKNGSKIISINEYACNYQETGSIIKKDKNGNYQIILEYPHTLGKWWIRCILNGKWPFCLPFINENPIVRKATPEELQTNS